VKCECGFKFPGSGEIRNCDAFINCAGKSGVICPECGIHYISGSKVVSPKSQEVVDNSASDNNAMLQLLGDLKCFHDADEKESDGGSGLYERITAALAQLKQ